MLMPAAAWAQNAGAGHYGLDATFDAVNKGGEVLPKSVAGGSDIPSIVGSVVAVFLSLFGVVFFLLALYAGFIWMTAMGKSEQVTKAKDILEAAAVGLVIVAAAYAITSFVFSNLVGETTNAPSQPASVTVTCKDCQAVCIKKSCPQDCKDVNIDNVDETCTQCITKEFKTVSSCQSQCTPEISRCTQ